MPTPPPINTTINSRSDMIAAIRAIQQFFGTSVCSGIDNEAVGQQIVKLQKYLSTVPNAADPSGFMFDPAKVKSYIADTGLAEAIIQLQVIASIPPATMRQVSRRTHLFSALNAYNSSMSRVWDQSFVDMTAIEVTLPNWYVRQSDGAEIGPGGTSTFAVAIEYPVGVYTQLKVAGTAVPTVADGANVSFTGNVTIPKNTTYWYRIFMANSGGNMMNVNFANSYDPSRGDAFTFNGPDQTMGGALDDNGSSSFCVFPAVVRALSTLGVWVEFGDSTTNGVNDITPDATGATGWYGRALSAKAPYCNFGCSGDQLTWFINNSAKRRALAAFAGMTKGINGYGINDIIQGRLQAQLEADRQSFIGFFPSLPIYDITVPPQTVGGPTAAGQTSDATKTARRIAINTARRASVPGAAGLIDIAALVETDTAHETSTVLNGGVWLPSAWGDGVHPNTAGYKLVTPLVAPL